jgi:PAS domain S-box-containing protein
MNDFIKFNFEAVIDVAPDPVLLVAQDGVIAYANIQAERVFGYERSELIGVNVDMLVPRALRPSHVDFRNGYFAQAKVRPMGVGLELAGERKDGKLIPVEISLSPISNENGRWVMAIVRDVTASKQVQRQLKKQAEELERSNAELEQFASVASHDLQEPLKMIERHLVLFKRECEKHDCTSSEHYDTAYVGVQRMQALIEDLLAYSRVGRKNRRTRQVPLSEAVEHAIANLDATVAKCGASISMKNVPELPVDETAMVQLFQNLIGNALKFCPADRKPEVSVDCEVQADFMQIQVRDNGIGIDPKHHERIFDVFQRLHRRDEFEGTGIGLAICKKIVESAGGQIWVESTVGKGTSFFFTIPVLAAEV